MRSYVRIGFLQILNIVMFVAMLAVNGLADFLPLNGQTTGAIADQYPNLFTPAQVTFAIWLVIYSLLVLFCIYQGSTLFEIQKRRLDRKEVVVDIIGPLFILSCVLNIAWIFAWHFHFLFISVIVMLALLVTLSRLYLKIHARAMYNGREKWFVYIPFSIYLGWISVATIANISAWLVSVQWNGFNIDPWIWTGVMIIVATILGVLMVVRKSNIAYAGVIIWALLGIIIKQYSVSAGFNNISLTALSGILLLLLLIAWKLKARQPVLTS